MLTAKVQTGIEVSELLPTGQRCNTTGMVSEEESVMMGMVHKADEFRAHRPNGENVI